MGSINPVAKALYPANRWRDSHDFDTVSVLTPAKCFLAPDKVTIIPECYDLARASCVLDAYPGKSVYAADEYDKRLVKMDVDIAGRLSNLKYFVEQGEFGLAVDETGSVYVADGQIYIFDANGKRQGMIKMQERPSSLQFGGRDRKILFITTRSSLYGVRIGV
jgi:hypothetical protein